MHNGDRKPVGVLGIEADTAALWVRLATIRNAFWMTCLAGLAIGVGAGFVVWRLQARSVATHIRLEESHLTEEAIITSLGEVVYTFDTTARRFHWRGDVAALPCAEGDTSQSDWTARIHPEDRALYEHALRDAVENARP